LDTSNPFRAFEETVQFILIRAFDEVHEKKDQVMKRELSFSSEILRGLSMLGRKIVREDNFFQKINKFGTYFGKQGPCQSHDFFRYFLTFFSPFEQINR